MSYALIQNDSVLEYPLEEGAIKSRFSNTSFPTPFEPPAGYVEIADAAQPTIDYTKNITEGTPVKDKGVWTRTWVVSNATTQEVNERTARQSEQMRQDRNRRLAASDWTQLSDTPGVTRAAYVQYRQALRDVPQQPGYPWNITWPTEP
jgi:hypothetical protein